MEPVYCQNGHPNRPGTRICAVCRELLTPPPLTLPTPVDGPQKTQAPHSPTASRSLPPKPEVEPASLYQPVADEKPATPQRSRIWIVLLLIALLGFLGIVAVWAIFFPVTRTSGMPPTAVFERVPVVTVTTSTLVPKTTVKPTSPASTQPAETPTADVTSPTAVATITPLPTIVGVVITPTFAFGRDVNFMQNGSFTDDWANGWTRDTRGHAGVIATLPDTEEPNIQVLHLDKTGAGMLRLAQRVVLAFPVEGLVFRGKVRLAGTVDGNIEGRSALILRYEDANGDPLGASVWLDGSTDTTELWGSSPLPLLGPSVRARYVDEAWQTLEIWLDRELAEQLPAIDPVAVRQITVFLAVLSSDECEPAGCEAILEASTLSLTAEAP